MTKSSAKTRSPLTRELVLLLGSLLFGLLILPLLIFVVGREVFGDFAGGGLGAFFGAIHSALRAGDWIVWFLILSPYAIVQTLRGSFRLFKTAGRQL